jgi:hypothetical protein
MGLAGESRFGGAVRPQGGGVAHRSVSTLPGRQNSARLQHTVAGRMQSVYNLYLNVCVHGRGIG